MNEQTMTAEQIRREEIQTLTEKLGVVGMIRFLQLFDNGQDDYTKQRHEWPDKQELENIIQEAKTKCPV